MTGRELVRRTLRFEAPPRVPRHLKILPSAAVRYPEEIAHLRHEFPDDIITAPSLHLDQRPQTNDFRPTTNDVRPTPNDVRPTTNDVRPTTNDPRPTTNNQQPTTIDPWGCRFTKARDGLPGIVCEPLIASWDDLAHFTTPEHLAALDREAINRFCRATDRFVLAGTLVRPFERLMFLRSPQVALADVLQQPPELFELLGMIHSHYVKELQAWAETDVDAVVLMDDWGSNDRLLIAPDTWRRVFRPLYREYCQIASRHGKAVIMHSDGCVLDIIPDLMEIGVGAVNTEIALLGAARLGKFRGRVTFWGETDRHLLAFGTPEAIRRSVNETHENLWARGGVIAQCELGPDARPENIAELFRAWNAVHPPC